MLKNLFRDHSWLRFHQNIRFNHCLCWNKLTPWCVLSAIVNVLTSSFPDSLVHWLQVTEEDIALCMGETENPLPEVDQEEHPLRILSEENLTVVSTFTGESTKSDSSTPGCSFKNICTLPTTQSNRRDDSSMFREKNSHRPFFWKTLFKNIIIRVRLSKY